MVRLASEEYVPVTADDWYQRRRDDAEGEFFRKMADRAGRTGPGGSTRQGIYCFTADGTVLIFKNNAQPESMRQQLQYGLERFKALPEAQRKPGAVKVDDAGKEDPNYTRKLPPGGLIVNVSTRILDRDKDAYTRCTTNRPGHAAAARDHLWLTAEEWKSLIPTTPKRGETLPVPRGIAERVLRFHLVDNTRGEPPMWRRDEIRQMNLTRTVEEAGEKGLLLRLDGTAHLATANQDRGYDARLRGWIRYDFGKKAIDRFDLVALGDHWGQGRFTGGARPGKQPLGVAFELSAGNTAGDCVPPQGAREVDEYFGRNR